MAKMKVVLAVVVVVSTTCSYAPRLALAVDFTPFTWTGGSAPPTDWQVDGNWDLADFPNDGLHSATIAAGTDLTVELGATDIKVAALTLNGTSATTDIDIASAGGGILYLQNDDDNTYIDISDADEIAPKLAYIGNNNGRVVLTSNGVSGSTSQISAPVRLSNSGFLEGVDVVGSRSLTLAGNIDITGVDDDMDEGADIGQLRSYLPAGEKVLLSGNISLTDPLMIDPEDPEMDPFPRSLGLNSFGTTDHGTVGDATRQPPRGTIEVSGNVSGTGGLQLGWEWFPHQEQEGNDPAPPPATPLSTIILSGNNTYTGDTAISRANVVIHSDTAFGTGTVRQQGHSGDSKEVGYNIVVDGADRTIANPLAIVQWQTFKGDHSLNWTGRVYLDGSRGIINLLPYDYEADDGETLTFSGPVYGPRETENSPLPGRIFTFDGTGKTIITGGVHDYWDNDPMVSNTRVGSLRKRGTGTLVIDYDEGNVTDTHSDYSGHTWVESGNLHFGTNDDLPNPGVVFDALVGQVISSGGALGVNSGVIGNSQFLSMLNNSANPTNKGTTPPYFYVFNDQNAVIFTTYDHGGLMLGDDEYGNNLDFSSGDLNNAANMSLAAWETDSEYTGTITPAANLPAFLNQNNTYRLGGGTGTLTLPNANQLTGARNLRAMNGGEVHLSNTNDYTGTTTVMGKFHTSLQEYAEADSGDPNNDGDYTDNTQQLYLGTTLTATTLSNGGVNSSIGKSSNDADNLVIQGSTLKYVGAATSTDRLFTVGTAGATLDASGTGAVNFSNTGALAIDFAEDRTGILNTGVPDGSGANNEIWGGLSAVSTAPFNTDDLVPGMAVRDINASPALPEGAVISGIPGPHAIKTSLPFADATAVIRSVDFGPAPARYLTLTGSNPDDNTLSPVVGDAADIIEATGAPGGNGSVGIRKSGIGTWVLAAENTYTGQTLVEEGTLKVNGTTGTGDTIVSGGTLKGTGHVGGDLIVQSGGTVDPGLSPGKLFVDGNYTQDVGGTLKIEIQGTGAGQFDVLAIDDGVSTGLLGDYNENDEVDAADYTTWRDALTAGATSLPNDPTPGTVDESDFLFWRDHFGEVPGSGSNTATADLAGEILIDLLSFSPNVNDMFTILTAGSVTDNGLSLAGESAGFDLIVNASNVVLKYVGASGSGAGSAAVPEPSAILLSSLAFVAMVGWGRRRKLQ